MHSNAISYLSIRDQSGCESYHQGRSRCIYECSGEGTSCWGPNYQDKKSMTHLHPSTKAIILLPWYNFRVHTGTAFLLHQITNCSCYILHNLYIQQNHHVRFLWGTSILYLLLRKTVNGSYVKMKQTITTVVTKTLYSL